MDNRTVAVLSLGGTISCAPSRDATGGGLVPTSDPADFLPPGDFGLRSIRWSLTDSSEITFDEIVRLAHEVRRQAALGADAVVITQGTDTLEETAYALSLLQPLDHPVVFTAAMRAPTVAGSDAAANLGAAITTAIDPQLALATSGAVVVMNDQIHSARWVHKTHTQRLDAFCSREPGNLGVLSEGRPLFLRRDAAPTVPGLLDQQTAREIKVALYTAALDQDTTMIEALPDFGYHGVVVAGLGGGHVSAAAAVALGRIAQDIPVLYASRTGAGAVLTRTYGSPGAELDLLRQRCVPAGHLTPIKARVLLTLLLRSGRSRTDVEALVMREGNATTPVPP